MTGNGERKGTFIINDSFKVTNRGLVLAGNILEGTVSVGDLIEFTVSQSKRQRLISGVEDIRTSKTNTGTSGLLIQCKNEDEIIELNDWEPKSEVGVIFKAE